MKNINGLINKNGARFPLEYGQPYRISSPMGDRPDEQGGTQWHEGIDIGVDGGTKILAVEKGIVVRVMNGLTEADGKTAGFRYGNHIIIKHPNNVYSLAAHCSKILVREGDTVTLAQHVADSGNTGWSTDDHIHFELVQGTNDDTWQDHWSMKRFERGSNEIDRLNPEKFQWS